MKRPWFSEGVTIEIAGARVRRVARRGSVRGTVERCGAGTGARTGRAGAAGRPGPRAWRRRGPMPSGSNRGRPRARSALVSRCSPLKSTPACSAPRPRTRGHVRTGRQRCADGAAPCRRRVASLRRVGGLGVSTSARRVPWPRLAARCLLALACLLASCGGRLADHDTSGARRTSTQAKPKESRRRGAEADRQDALDSDDCKRINELNPLGRPEPRARGSAATYLRRLAGLEAAGARRHTATPAR